MRYNSDRVSYDIQILTEEIHVIPEVVFMIRLSFETHLGVQKLGQMIFFPFY